MKTSEAGSNFIKEFERLKLVPYKCSGGYWTAGWGHLLKLTQLSNIQSEYTIEDANVWFEQDIRTAESAVSRLIRVAINQGQFDALVSFTFNLGSGALQRSTLRLKLNREEYRDAADEFLKWVKAGGRTLRGLVRRRVAERAIFAEAI